MAFTINIEKESLQNDYYRKVLFTGKNQQLVVMSLLPNEDIPEEVHKDHDQFIRVERGTAIAIINKLKIHKLSDGDSIIIPAGTIHKIINISSSEKLKLYTIYSPPEHASDRVDKTKPN